MSIFQPIIPPLLLNDPLPNPRTNQKRRNPNAQPRKVKRHGFSIRCSFSIREIITSWYISRWRNMIAEAAVLVKCEDKEG